MSLHLIYSGLTKYPLSLIDMDIAVETALNSNEEFIFFTEHETLYSAGKSYEKVDFLQTPKHPVYYPNRGGRITVHSPGQLVIYPVINLISRNLNIHDFISILELWIINSLKDFGIAGHTSDQGVGVWVDNAKIGFIGIHVTHGISSHGLCVNVANDVSLFDIVVPCGLHNLSVGSISNFCLSVSFESVVKSFISYCPFSL